MLRNRSLTMNFPDWFYFASILLLRSKTFQDSFHSDCAVGSAKTNKSDHTESNCYSSAAQFIAWILYPCEKFHQDLLFDHLSKVSKSWTLTSKSNKATTHHLHGYNFRTLYVWLQEFHDCRQVYKSLLLRKIPLGIMIGCLACIDDEGCQLLLHYAAIGTIFQLAETQDSRWTEQYSTKEAIAGACVVFDLTDLTESISASIFESEESGLDFLCRVKLKAGKYLFNCTKRLLQLKVYDDGFFTLKDLCKRLVRWRDQGRDVFTGDQDLDEIIDALNQVIM